MANSLRHLLFKEQGGQCYYCFQPMTLDGDSDQLCTRDHKIPQSLGGSNHRSNIVAACKWCNTRKGSLSVGEFRSALAAGAFEGITEAKMTYRADLIAERKERKRRILEGCREGGSYWLPKPKADLSCVFSAPLGGALKEEGECR